MNNFEEKRKHLMELEDFSPFLSYKDLRTVIHNILNDFIVREFECHDGGEFDFEYEEMTADRILRLIRKQGGSTSNGDK